MNAILNRPLAVYWMLAIALAIGGNRSILGEEPPTSSAPASPAPPRAVQRLGTVSPRYARLCVFNDEWLLTVPTLFGNRPSDAIAVLYDLKTGKLLQKFAGHTETIRSLAVSADGKYVITCGGRLSDVRLQTTDSTVRIWDFATGKELKRFGGPKDRLTCGLLGQDNRRLLTVSDGSNEAAGFAVSLWDVDTERRIYNFPGDIKDSPLLSPDGKIVLGRYAGAMPPDQLILWDSLTGKKKLTVFEDMRIAAGGITFDPTSSFVLTTAPGQSKLQVWDVKTGKRLQVFGGDSGYDHEVGCFSSDGRFVATALNDRTARLWNTKTGEDLKQFVHWGSVYSVLLSNDGKSLFTGWSDSSTIPFPVQGALWDVETGKDVMELQRYDEFVGFSPDGSRFLTRQNVKNVLDGHSATWFDSSTGKAIERPKGN